MLTDKILSKTYWFCYVIYSILPFGLVFCLVKEDEYLEIEELPMPDLFVYPSMGFKLTLPVLREEVINVSFFGNINKTRNKETKDLEKNLVGTFKNLTVKWVYENENFVFKTTDTLHAWIGFLLRDGNTFWDVKSYEIWYWRLHSLGVTTTASTTEINVNMFDIFEADLGKIHPEIRKLLKTSPKTTRKFQRKVTYSAQKIMELRKLSKQKNIVSPKLSTATHQLTF